MAYEKNPLPASGGNLKHVCFVCLLDENSVCSLHQIDAFQSRKSSV
jgi:hypothetical protein